MPGRRSARTRPPRHVYAVGVSEIDGLIAPSDRHGQIGVIEGPATDDEQPAREMQEGDRPLWQRRQRPLQIFALLGLVRQGQEVETGPHVIRRRHRGEHRLDRNPSASAICSAKAVAFLMTDLATSATSLPVCLATAAR
jgi:hypothetical protein